MISVDMRHDRQTAEQGDEDREHGDGVFAAKGKEDDPHGNLKGAVSAG